MKYFVVACLVVSLVFSPVASVYAEKDGELSQRQQLSAISAYLTHVTGVDASNQMLTEADMKQVIDDGVSWLLSAQEESGHFAYEYVPYDDVYLDDDNIVRQGGALFVLGEMYRKQEKKDVRVQEGIERAVTYFESISLEGEHNGTAFRCVANSKVSNQCKLGATALVLLGLLGYVEGNPKRASSYETLIDDYTQYILASQKEAGGFSNVFRKSSGFASEESPFSNGEALLALVRVYQYKESTQIKDAIDTAFTYLEEKAYDSALYLWIMAALKDMQTLWPSDVYVDYARNFTQWRMALAPAVLKDKNYCAYAEGVASAYSVLQSKPHAGELEKLQSSLAVWNAHHATLQVSSEDAYRVVIDEEGTPVLKVLKRPAIASGGFLTAHTHPTQRIDFTQHCVSTYLQTLVDIEGRSL